MTGTLVRPLGSTPAAGALVLRRAALAFRRWVATSAVVVAAVCAAGCGSQPAPDPAKDQAVQDGVQAIRAAVFLAAGGPERAASDPFPPADRVTEAGIGSLIGTWPVNPYTGRPMAPGSGPGDFRYTLSDNGRSYSLEAFGVDGAVLVQVQGP
jgi:hypothetical protein